MKAKLLNQCVCLLACWFLCFVHHLFHGFVIVKGTHGLETQFRNILWWSNLRLRSKICFTWSMGFERKIIVLKLFVANWEDPDFVSAVGLPTALFEASRAFKGPKGLWNRWWKNQLLWICGIWGGHKSQGETYWWFGGIKLQLGILNVFFWLASPLG